MTKIEFQKTLFNVLSEYGFVMKNGIARVETDDLIIVVSTQKSNFENSYYLNYGFLIKELRPDLARPKDNQCDVFGRLNLTVDGKLAKSVDYEKTSSELFSIALKNSLNDRIKPVLEFGLNKYFELYPKAISTVRLDAKKYLGLS